MTEAGVRAVLELYPRIFAACHRRHVRGRKTGRTLSAHQASILGHLDAVEPTSLGGLARHVGVTPATMSLAVDRLVRKGYVARARDAADRRRLNLRLTRAGERIKAAQSVLEPELVRRMLERLTAAERAAGLRGLALLARAADEARHRGGPPRKARRPSRRTAAPRARRASSSRRTQSGA